MELARQQELLARLYTQAGLRQRFFRDPDAVLRELGFESDPASPCLQWIRAEVQSFAQSLQRKRLQDTEKVLPVTRRLAGEAFATWFLEYAERPRPAGPGAGLEDALAFVEFLERTAPARAGLVSWTLDLIRYEAAQRRAVGARLLCRGFRHAVHGWGGSVSVPPSRGAIWVIWFRRTQAGRLRRWVITWPRWIPSKMS